VSMLSSLQHINVVRYLGEWRLCCSIKLCSLLLNCNGIDSLLDFFHGGPSDYIVTEYAEVRAALVIYAFH
jgi:hypothetical protein